ncbi:MAG: M20/M25/M40 family metallo-hydrolase, partial [Pseudomonadales bacterium]|nr:M20/M25/M40 family metallo-hydrolase [Pseudomonadales bacterium]
MDHDRIHQFISDAWDKDVLDSLARYIEIPNKSPMFDPDWAKNGYMMEAVNHMMSWVESQDVDNLNIELHELEGRTPTLLIDRPGEIDETVLIYGHLDKQPEFSGWHDGLGPWTPVLKDNRLYGRGGADDGYALYAAVTAIKSLIDQGLPLPRVVILIEASEESGSPDLPYYMDSLSDKIGEPGLVIALDSTCGNYDQLWITTSLRGMLVGDLTVRVLEQGAHSGAAGGIVASSFRILRQLLGRLEDETDGRILPSFLNEQIPTVRREEAELAGQGLADDFPPMYPFAGEGKPVAEDPTELVLNNTWLASLEITGIDGIPAPGDAGNVLRPSTTAKLALRLPPTTDAVSARDKLAELLTRDPPHGAEVTFKSDHPNPGWHSPVMVDHLRQSVEEASTEFFGGPAVSMGCGGSIPFMEFLANKLPKAQFIVTGVLGPHSNAHGPNEFLHIPCAKSVTACVAKVIHDW